MQGRGMEVKRLNGVTNHVNDITYESGPFKILVSSYVSEEYMYTDKDEQNAKASAELPDAKRTQF